MKSTWMSMFFVFPIVVGWHTAKTLTITPFLITVVLMYFTVAVIPFCRKNENLWVFVLTAVAMSAINVKIAYEICQIVLFGEAGIITCSLSFVLYWLILLSIEEIVFGVIARIIWRRQEKIF